MTTWCSEYYRLKRSINTPADTAAIPDELAYLDRLEGGAFQAAIDKLTPKQLERYEDMK